MWGRAQCTTTSLLTSTGLGSVLLAELPTVRVTLVSPTARHLILHEYSPPAP